ncbi:MAG: succinyl-diaminopimelate desuccinylase, partial [Alphaproteobacteria bacterium]|nr:succinyl-diaminopimelate desuccinylase [Alphaproteobacteria bacterium]
MPDIDTVKLAQDLIRCPSITPEEGGALDLLEKHLSVLGFTCHRLPFGEGKARVDNLYARVGTEAPHLCFAGHTDVVPIGVRKDWQHDPFGGVNDGEVLWGRGAVDMKGAIAAFVSAVSSYIESGNNKGSISFLITGDEEGVAINGTRKMLDWLRKEGETIDDCLVGEPTNPETLGEMIKIGRRGSVNVVLKMRGKEGHVAYPHLAQNPIAALLAVLTALNNTPLDEGNEHFQASHLE